LGHDIHSKCEAGAYYFAPSLAKYGLQLEPEVMQTLAAAPPQHDPAWSWFNLALIEQSRPHDDWVPDEYEATDYLRAKFHKRRNPDTRPWSTVV